jgi:hypothetical protein
MVGGQAESIRLCQGALHGGSRRFRLGNRHDALA